jgi:hypothetical protein
MSLVTDAVSAAGATFYIGGTGDLDSEASWTEIAEIIDGGEFGKKFDKIDYISLASRIHRKRKGGIDYGSLNISMARIPTDSGQEVVQEAVDSDQAYNFKVTLNDATAATGTGSHPTTYLFKALVMSYTTNIPNANDIVRATMTLEIDSEIEITAAH